MKDPMTWRKVSGETVFDHPILSLRYDRLRRADGREQNFILMDSPPWVNIVPVTAEGRVVLIRQYRPGVEGWTLEIPGGLVDPGEEPVAAAARELREETGYESDPLVPIGRVSPNPALFSNTCHTFLAPGARLAGPQRLDDDELIEVLTRPVGDLPGLVADGTIDHCLVIAAIAFYWLHVGGQPLAAV